MPLYFAYGSNLDNTQMVCRCPSAKAQYIAKLPDYEIAFSRRSVKRKCGVADAVPMKGCELWGVMYEISDIDLTALDMHEGFKGHGNPGNSYSRKSCEVIGILNGKEQCMNAFIYFAIPQAGKPKPSKEYKRLILDGAAYWKLPAHYLQKIEQIEVQE